MTFGSADFILVPLPAARIMARDGSVIGGLIVGGRRAELQQEACPLGAKMRLASEIVKPVLMSGYQREWSSLKRVRREIV
jgi:hypothetical protein